MVPRELLEDATQKTRDGVKAVVLFSFFINVLMLSSPMYMLQVYDRVLSSRSIDTLWLLSLIIVFALLTLGLLEMVRGRIMIRMGTWLDRRLAGTVLGASVALPLKLGTEPHVQGLRDLNQLRTYLSGSEIFCLLDAPWAPIFLAFVFLLHPVLGFVALAGAVVLFSLALLNEYLTRPLMSASNRANIQALQQAESAVKNADVIQAMGILPNLIARWDRLNEDVIEKQAAASARSGTISATSRFCRLALQTAMLGVGASLVIRTQLTPGGMIAGSILMSRALAPVEQAISSWKSAISSHGAYMRLKRQLEAAPVVAESMALPAPEGHVDVAGVTYFHPGQPEAMLRGLNFSLRAGDMLGLIGPSGSGKTTLARLLLGNLSPALGNVRLDGADISKWNPDERGRWLGYLPQDIELFSGTIKDNIARLGNVDAAQVVEAARLAGCHEMILKFPNGYDTRIGEGGANLSGGERQRVALARALYGNPVLVVLDEPNASLDGAGEEALQRVLEALKERRTTVVIIAHRPSIIQHVDKILVLADHRIQEFGDRDRVLKRLSESSEQTRVTRA